MLLTQKQSYTCPNCQHVYQGQEGLKHNSRTGEVLKFGLSSHCPNFDCVQCGARIEV